jgi:hypothetical protein
MNLPERRRVTRRIKRVPVVICRVLAAEAPSTIGEIISLSAWGVRFLSSTVVAPGTILQVFPRILNDGKRFPASAWPRTGKVSYVTRRATGEIEVGMRFTIRDKNRNAAKAIGWHQPVGKTAASEID